MSFESKKEKRALQCDEKIDLMFIALLFRLRKGRDPTLGELKTIWEEMS